MTAYSKVMSELASLVIQHFVSHHVQLSLGRETRAHWCWPWRPAKVRTLQDKPECLMAATGHLFEEMMANYDSLGNAGKVAGNSSNTQWRVHCVCRFRVVTLTLACYRLAQSRDSDVVAEDHHMFYKCYFAAVWNSLDVSAPDVCISAINPKMALRPMILPASLRGLGTRSSLPV